MRLATGDFGEEEQDYLPEKEPLDTFNGEDIRALFSRQHCFFFPTISTVSTSLHLSLFQFFSLFFVSPSSLPSLFQAISLWFPSFLTTSDLSDFSLPSRFEIPRSFPDLPFDSQATARSGRASVNLRHLQEQRGGILDTTCGCRNGRVEVSQDCRMIWISA
jgi:hypothetical protein